MDHTSRRKFLGLSGAAVAAALFAARGVASPGFAVTHTPAEWRRLLGPQRYRILREEGTERAWTSPLLKEHRKGIFACAGCGLPLFPSTTKYDSGTGWPSFWQALPNAVGTRRIASFGGDYFEEHCRRCGGHLGHVFDDGPPPTGKRHCIDGLALTFRPA